MISPWTASERGWKTFLAKGGSRLYKGNKKSIKLMGAQRAWWAVSGSKKNPKRQPKGAVPMEIDSISEGPKPGRCAGTALPGPASTGPKAPPGILKNRKKEAEDEIEAPGAQNPLSGTPFSFLFRGFVSEVSVSGPSEAPVFRDEAPEVREGPVEEPSDLKKDHVLEVVGHALPHEFSEVFLDCEFFPERPEAFRKLWHGVKFELVRKLCSLNFGMLGLFGMFGMTLLLAAVFAFGAFYGKGNDGQLVAYGGEWRTECARAGDWCTECARAGEWCTECARAGEWSYEGGRAGDWHDQCARGGWHNQCARGGWRSQCSRGGWRNQCARGGWSNQWARGVEAVGSYAAHVGSPGTPPSIPSLGPGRYNPSPDVSPRDSPAADRVSAQPVVIADDDAEAWGTWRAPPLAAADGPAEQAGGVVPAEDRETKRPRRGLPSGSKVQLSAVPVPGEAEDHLLRQVFMEEQQRRIQEALSLGIRLQAAEDEPLPMLSHYHGRPSSTEAMYDSLSYAMTDRGFLTRISLGAGSRYVPGGSSGITGPGRLDRPEEFLEETPYLPPRLPSYPEPEQPRPPKLMIDAATITDNALDEWSAWLRSARQGRSLREWGILASDLVTAIQYLSEAHPEVPSVTKGGRWSNAG